MTTATQPPGSNQGYHPLIAAMVALMAAAVALTATFMPVTAAFAAALAAWAAALAAFAVACAVFCAAFAACCAVFAERCAVLILLALCFTPFTDRLAVFTAFCGFPLIVLATVFFVRIFEDVFLTALPPASLAPDRVREISLFSFTFRAVACASFSRPGRSGSRPFLAADFHPGQHLIPGSIGRGC